jgi:hypothetical protein
MKCFCLSTIALAFATLLFSSYRCNAQSGTDTFPSSQKATQLPNDLSGSSYKAKPIPQGEVVAPFNANGNRSEKENPLQYVSQDQMSAADRALAAGTDAKIREAATLAGMELDRGKWAYQQIVCSALPNHLFLIFTADNGPGDVSTFSAAIPRGGDGRIRIIPVERRGYSLFSPAPVNALTVSAFNRIRADEPANKLVDWLATALCYAALAGAHPAILPPTDTKNAGANLVFPPTLEIGNLGESTVRFADVSAEPQPTEWALTFSQKGQLVKVDHFAMPNFAITPVPAK